MAGTLTRKQFVGGALFLLVLGLILRCAGLMHGLDHGSVYHPDEPKQVVALEHYLNGQYVRYLGSLFYDGYPYGLNHVDELLLRPLLALYGGVRQWLGWAEHAGSVWQPDLFVWARGLRVVYGLLCILLAGFVGRSVLGRGPALWVMLLVATATLSIAVSHAASGDIGVDLFGTLALLAFCALKRSRLRFFGAGLAVGLAFACKYNGLLCAIPVALYLSGLAVRDRDVRPLLKWGVVAGCGALCGAVILTPTLLLAWKRTSHDILANFIFIKNYGLDEAFLQRPWYERIALSFTWHVPRLIHAFGYGLLLLALVGAAVSVCQVVRRGRAEAGSVAAEHGMLRAALFLYPFLALLISLLGKAEVQPFHFSYLVVPFALAAVFGFAWLWRSSRTGCVVALLIGLLMLGQGWRTLWVDRFFWMRQDNLEYRNDFLQTVWLDPVWPSEHVEDVIRDITLEPENPAVFRNRHRSVGVWGGRRWSAMKVAPVPAISYPRASDWIFANGPSFPRSDRVFVVERNRSVCKQVVLRQRPGALRLGLRSGDFPATVEIRYGGVKRSDFLAPNSQKELTLTPTRWMTLKEPLGSEQALFHVPLSVTSRGGDLQVSALLNAEEQGTFRGFGAPGDLAAIPMPRNIAPAEIHQLLAETRFLAGRFGASTLLSQETDGDAFALLWEAPKELPAGVYRVKVALRVLTDSASLCSRFEDRFGLLNVAAYGDIEARQQVQKDTQTVTFLLEKPFAPLQCQIKILCEAGRVLLDSWEVAPADERIWADVQQWREGGLFPQWAAPQVPFAAPPFARSEILFAQGIGFDVLHFPAVLAVGSPLRMACLPRVRPEQIPDLSEYDIFVHLQNAEGRLVYATGVSLVAAWARGQAGCASDLDPLTEVPPGTYTVHLGVWNRRTHKRLAISGEGLSAREHKKRVLCVGELRLE